MKKSKVAYRINKKPGEPLFMREVCLDSAKEMVLHSREADYSPPKENFRTVAEMLNLYFAAKARRKGAVDFEPHDVAVINILQKVARLATTPKKFDSWTDIAGYAACGAEVSGA